MRSVRALAWSALAVVGMTAVASAAPADSPKVVGDWQGTLKIQNITELRLVFHVSEAKDGVLSATMESPDQGSGKTKVDAVTAKDGAVKFDLKSIGGQFAGKFDTKGETIEGEWKQGGQSFPLTIKRFDPSKVKAAVVPAELEGIWEGKIDAGAGMQLRLVLKVTKDKDGKLVAVFRSPDQLDRDFPITSITIEGKTVKAVANSLASTYTGTLNAAKSEIVGKWKQGGAELPLTLKKTEKESQTRRPQTPKPPFGYETVNVSYENPAGKFKLAGTLTKPKGAGPFPVAIMITGSGQQDRDETLFAHKPFLVIADALTKRGIAVLRVDDRGVGGSSGSAEKATSEDFAGDVYAGITFLKGRKDIDAKRIGLVGHSEGGLIAPMVAAKYPQEVAFIVLLAGPGIDGASIIRMQSRLISKALGAKDDALAVQVKLIDDLIAITKSEKDDAVATKKIKEAAKKAVDGLTKEQKKAIDEGASEASASRAAMFASPWFRYFLSYDPRPTLQKVQCPVLAINGEKDLQVPAKEDLEAIAKALDAGGNSRYVVKELPGLNHLFQTCKTGVPTEYATIEETIAPSALKLIGDWVVETTAQK